VRRSDCSIRVGEVDGGCRLDDKRPDIETVYSDRSVRLRTNLGAAILDALGLVVKGKCPTGSLARCGPGFVSSQVSEHSFKE